jgi:signal peptidase I
VVQVVAIVAIIVVPIRTFVMKPFSVHGPSMEPTLLNSDYLLIDELSYHFRDPRRGEMVVFHDAYATGQFLIKRLIGLPGETVTVRNGTVTITNTEHPEGVILQEPYLGQTFTDGTMELTLADHEYFVLGDNRLVSFDSRRIGAVPANRLVGRAWVRGWPLGRLAQFSSPLYSL